MEDWSVSSRDIWIASKLAELAERCRLSPLNADIIFSERKSDDKGPGGYVISAIDIGPPSPGDDHDEKTEKLWSLLGLDELGCRRFDKISDVGEAIDRALALAPRARGR